MPPKRIKIAPLNVLLRLHRQSARWRALSVVIQIETDGASTTGVTGSSEFSLGGLLLMLQGLKFPPAPIGNPPVFDFMDSTYASFRARVRHLRPACRL